ncbi:MAG: hypothetical protein WCK63_12995 [Betaproteobacteria bacterium]
MTHCSSSGSHCKSKCFGIALMVVAGIALLTWVVMLLWNCLLPAVFPSVQTVNYWQALGLLVLSKILFGSFGGRCHGRFRDRQAHSLTPEERDQLKGRFMSRWSHCCGSDKTDDSASKPSAGTQ